MDETVELEDEHRRGVCRHPHHYVRRMDGQRGERGMSHWTLSFVTNDKRANDNPAEVHSACTRYSIDEGTEPDLSLPFTLSLTLCRLLVGEAI